MSHEHKDGGNEPRLVENDSAACLITVQDKTQVLLRGALAF